MKQNAEPRVEATTWFSPSIFGGRFTRKQFKQIAIRTPADRVKAAFARIIEMMSRTNDKGDLAYDR